MTEIEENLIQPSRLQENCPEKTLCRKRAGHELSEKVQMIIDSRSSEKFSLRDLSDELFVNECHLIRTFKKNTGLSPLEYQHQVRCRKAEELLKNPRLKISYISDTVGFSTQAHFTRIFRSINACTPTEFRKQFLESRKLTDSSENCHEGGHMQ